MTKFTAIKMKIINNPSIAEPSLRQSPEKYGFAPSSGLAKEASLTMPEYSQATKIFIIEKIKRLTKDVRQFAGTHTRKG